MIVVSGNHELYGGSLLDLSVMRTFAARHKVDFLENSRTTISNVRFLGATLWSDFSLYGEEKTQNRAMREAQASIADYRAIRSAEGYPLEPGETLRRHAETVAFLDNELGRAFEGGTVVVTHFAPHRGCIAPQFLGGALTPYLVSDLAWLMKKHDIDVWCHGHTHTNVDFVAENGCRVVSNQMGYAWEYEYGDMDFRPDLIIEV